jgi:hypothetical protein
VVGVGVAVGDGYVVAVGVGVEVGVGVAVAVGVGVATGGVDWVATGVGLEDGEDELRPGDGERDGFCERSAEGESDPLEADGPAVPDGSDGPADDADLVSRDPGRCEVVTGTAEGLGGSPLAAASG